MLDCLIFQGLTRGQPQGDGYLTMVNLRVTVAVGVVTVT